VQTDVIELHDIDTAADPFGEATGLPSGAELSWATGAGPIHHAVRWSIPSGGDVATARTRLEAWLHAQAVPPGEHFALRSERTPGGGTRLETVLVSDASLLPHGSFAGGTLIDPDGTSSLGTRISVGVSPEADSALRSVTAAHLGRAVAVLIDGDVHSTPIVRDAFGGPALVLMPPDLPHAEQVAWCRHVLAELQR
jgi:hypothetical protein